MPFIGKATPEWDWEEAWQSFNSRMFSWRKAMGILNSQVSVVNIVNRWGYEGLYLCTVLLSQVDTWRWVMFLLGVSGRSQKGCVSRHSATQGCDKIMRMEHILSVSCLASPTGLHCLAWPTRRFLAESLSSVKTTSRCKTLKQLEKLNYHYPVILRV